MDVTGGGTVRDVAVVGAGPCGLAVGVAAREAGLSCVLFDRGPLVGTIERYPLRTRFFSTAEKLEIGGVPFITEEDKPTRAEALAYYRRVARHFELDIRLYEEVREARREGDGFLLRTVSHVGVRREVRARWVVVATGQFDHFNPLDVPGEDLPKVTHYFREPHLYYGEDVLVVGGGNSAVEAALRCWRAGARVTLAHVFDDFDPGVKPWVLPDIRNRIQEGAIPALWRHEVLEIEAERVRLRDREGGEERILANDWVLAMTGYRPDYGLLRALGIEIREGAPVFDRESLETGVPGVYVAGVLVAGLESGKLFIENGRHHGARIVRHMTRGGSRSAGAPRGRGAAGETPSR